ncbi:MAG TPA: type II toxin-antitoxin system HicB family antitoxin [Chloroflexia bacterium]|nr:type II toxin-antitoxin system HicB family antitoxin [Chloroflexia bacterium]
MNKFTLPIIIEKDQDGYFAFCPVLQGCYTQGGSYEEALTNIEDAMRLHIEDRLANGESIRVSEMVSLATLEVQV